MAGLFLFRNLRGKFSFDSDRVRACVRGLPGIRNLDESNPRYVFFCEFDFGDDSTIAYMLSEDLQFVSIEGMGDASLQFALEFGTRYGDEVHAVDEDGSSFDIVLSTVSSRSDFEDKINRSEGSDNLPPG
jgi:hypothetical protein